MYSVFESLKNHDFAGADEAKTDEKIKEIVSEFERAMNDNFNTLEVIAAAFGWFNFINAELTKKTTEYDLQKIADKIKELFAVFNILQHNPDEYIAKAKRAVLQEHNLTESDIEKSINERAVAKQNKDWAVADKIRADLLEKGIVLKDNPSGTVWDINL
jgi:cysteinyl-tRNA synthetase